MASNYDSIGKYISILYRSANMYFSIKFEKYNIGSGQHLFLIFLVSNEGVTQEEISSNLFIDKGTTAKAIKKLESVGYVKRLVDDKDKRAYKVYLTDEGKRTAIEIFSILQEWNNILTSDFTAEERELTLKLLNRMLKNKNKLINKGEYK